MDGYKLCDKWGSLANILYYPVMRGTNEPHPEPLPQTIGR